MIPQVPAEADPVDFPRKLRAVLDRKLLAVRRPPLIAPDLAFGRHRGPPAADARQSATAVLLYPYAGNWHLLLILRTTDTSTHSGQISLPGGGVDPGETFEQAGMRELEEELGINAADVAILGRLSPQWVFASRNWVVPIVAWIDRRSELRPNPSEVEAVLEVPLLALFDGAAHAEHLISRRGLDFRAPHFQWGPHRVWGATYLMLRQFAAVVEAAMLAE